MYQGGRGSLVEERFLKFLLFTLFILFKLLYTAYRVACMPMYIVKEG